jgi:hypothetical protein
VRLSLQANYLRSNSITDIDFPVTPQAKMLVNELLMTTSQEPRQALGQALVNELSSSAKIEPVTLKVSPTRQYHKKYLGRVVFKQYGYYRPKTRYVYIQNQTPVRGQDLAPRTFLDTLLHEWMHHFDHYKLQINSIHTSGFYLRLRALKEHAGLGKQPPGD